LRKDRKRHTCYRFRSHWPGNIRELEHTIERLTIIVEGQELKPLHISNVLFKTETHTESLIPKNIYELNNFKKQIRDASIQEIEKLFIIEALNRNNWNISKASIDVRMQRSNFQALIKKYGVKKPEGE
jgi:DNA-binding NtrC family response regulator